MKKTTVLLFTLISWLVLSNTLLAEEFYHEIYFVGLKNSNWQLHTSKEREKFDKIKTHSEPRTPTLHQTTGEITYIASDGSLRQQNIGSEAQDSEILLEANAQKAYTQPAYDPSGKKLYVVALKEGASVDTDILQVDLSSKKVKPVVTQRSAQFEPMLPDDDTLIYSNVICTVGCGKIIQEIWIMNLVSGEARQLTLLNSISRQAFLSPKGDWLYFSSNKQGNFHIWRFHMETNQYEQLTQGQVTDINPVVDQAGNLYFIRRSPEGIALKQLDAQGELRTLPVPEGVTDLRDLGLGS